MEMQVRRSWDRVKSLPEERASWERGQGLDLRAPQVSVMRQELKMEEEWLGFLLSSFQPSHHHLGRRNTSSEDSELICCGGRDFKNISPPACLLNLQQILYLSLAFFRATEPIWDHVYWHWNLLQDEHWEEKDCNQGQPPTRSVG